MNKKVVLILKIIISIGLLFVITRLVPYGKLVDIYANSKKIYIYLGFLAFFLCLILGGFRWWFLLLALNIKVSLKEAMLAFFSSYSFNLIFPSFVAGDIFRGFTVSSRYGELKKVASSVLMDRFSGSAGLALIVIFSLIIGKEYIFSHQEVLYSLAVYCFITAIVSLYIFSKTIFMFSLRVLKKGSPLKEKMISFHDQLYFFRNNLGAFMLSLLFSISSQILTILSFFITSKAFALNVEFIYFLILVPIIAVAAIIPITIAGAGTRETAAIYFFSLAGIEKSIGLGISLLNLAFYIVVGVLGGLVYVSIYHRRLQPSS